MKNDSRQKKTSISVVKRVFSFILVVIVFATSVCVFATSTNGIDFSAQPFGVGSYNLMDLGNGDYLTLTVNSGICYVFTGPNGNNENSGSVDMYIFSSIADNFTLNKNLNTALGNQDVTLADETYIRRYFYGIVVNKSNILVPYYGPYLYNNAINDLENYIENYTPPPPPVTGKPLNYTLPAGNIAYLEIDSNLFNGVNLATIMPELSGVGSGDPWSLSSQFYTMTDDMLLNGVSVYDLNGTRIVWNKSPNASTNLLGQTDHAVWESEGPYSNKTYFVICNPFYFFDNENNSSITIVANGIKNVYVQPLKTVVQQNGNEISYNTTVDGGTYEGEVTDDLGPIEWTDPDGGNTAPGTSTSNTPVTGINQFQQWLQGILQQIISVFEPAHDAITTLASAVQNFSGWLKALYIWLPSPVLNLLTSAISLAIIIGVIKVFI